MSAIACICFENCHISSRGSFMNSSTSHTTRGLTCVSCWSFTIAPFILVRSVTRYLQRAGHEVLRRLPLPGLGHDLLPVPQEESEDLGHRLSWDVEAPAFQESYLDRGSGNRLVRIDQDLKDLPGQERELPGGTSTRNFF